MKIDWFTLLAQIVNFLIILVLLKHFLYDRIVNAMDKRKQKIADRLQEAEEARKQAEEEKEKYMEKSEKLDKQRDEKLTEAREKAEAERKERIKQARKEVEEQQAQWRESLKREKATFLRDLRRRVGEQVFVLSRRVLNDLANDALEQRIIQVFIERVKKLEKDKRDALKQVMTESGESLIICSSFEVGDKGRKGIEKALNEAFDNKTDLQFKTSGELICGIEIQADGQKLAWSVDGYLDELEKDMSDALKDAIGTETSNKKQNQKNG